MGSGEAISIKAASISRSLAVETIAFAIETGMGARRFRLRWHGHKANDKGSNKENRTKYLKGGEISEASEGRPCRMFSVP
jgi:hypothetical protein